MKDNQKQPSNKLLLIIIAVLLVILLAGAGMLLGQKNSGPVTNTDSTAKQDFEFEEEQTQKTEEAAEAPGIEIPGYSIIPIKANTTDVEIDLYNPEGNNVYFQLTFRLKETNEQLFESKLLKPGQHLYNITLEKGLPAGDHAVTIQYSTFSTDGEYTPKNGATVDCIIRAE